MTDSITIRPDGGNTVDLAADKWVGRLYPTVKIAFGPSCTAISEADPLPVAIISGGGGGSSGGLTNTELRATPVPVSGSFYPATQPVSGTFWQATQPVSIASMPSTPVTGTFWQATQPVSIGATVAVSGPVTDAQLRASAVPVVAPTLTKGTQAATGLSTQHLRDAGRAIVNAATAIAGVTAVTSEALLTLAISRDAAATANATTIAVTSGKRLRIIGITAGVISSAAAVISARVCLRMNPSGAAAASSPILAILPLSQQAAALAQAGDTCVLMFSEAIEISGTMQVGLSQVASVTTGTIWASLIGYEY